MSGHDHTITTININRTALTQCLQSLFPCSFVNIPNTNSPICRPCRCSRLVLANFAFMNDVCMTWKGKCHSFSFGTPNLCGPLSWCCKCSRVLKILANWGYRTNETFECSSSSLAWFISRPVFDKLISSSCHYRISVWKKGYCVDATFMCIDECSTCSRDASFLMSFEEIVKVEIIRWGLLQIE